MTKALIFDIEGVILDEPGTKAREILCKKFNIDPERFKKYAIKNLPKSYSGKLHYLDFFKGVIKQEKLNISPREMASEWVKTREKISKIDKEVRRFIISLKKRYVVGSFTNSTLLNDKAKQRKEVYKLFDFNIIFHKHGFCKPEKKAYAILVAELKKRRIKKEEVIFIDNDEKNLVIPKKIGIKTILFENLKKLKENLENIER